ncbi:hypothetical protein PMI40_01038 [Herbaspirillum sp. YR522]|nr:hypothetical protein PMI40_01038 [Herbaspirillum sp. YR522]
MEPSTVEIGTVQRLVDLHFDLWNDTDPQHWRDKFSQVYTPDIIVADYAGMARGYDSVAQLLQRVQGQHAGFVFSPQAATWNHGLGRVTWGYGPDRQPALVRGEDIFTIRDGKLASLHVFIEKP